MYALQTVDRDVKWDAHSCVAGTWCNFTAEDMNAALQMVYQRKCDISIDQQTVP